MTEKVRKRRYIPVTSWNKYHDYPSLSALRHLIHDAENKNFSKVVKRVGRRCLIDEEAMFDWIDEQNKEENNG